MKILNFGSLNIDYVYKVDHFVRAGETLGSSSLEQFCGGKGLNQSVAFAKAGCDTYHAGCIGKEGGFLLDMLKENGVNTDFVKTSDGASGHAIIQVSSQGENCILLYGGANQQIDDEHIETVMQHFNAEDVLILQNEINALPKIIQKANEIGMSIVLNPSPFNEKIAEIDLNKINWLILNETEGTEITRKNSPEDIITELITAYPQLKIVLTLGKSGSIYAHKSERIHQDIFTAKAVDTTAAGDTFTGFFFSAYLKTQDPAYALKLASAASSITVSRMGAAPSIPTIDEIKDSHFFNI